MLSTATSPLDSRPHDSGIACLRDGLQADLLSGYDDLIARTAWDRARLRSHQRNRLRGLLRTAATRSAFHAGRLAGLEIDAVQPDDLSALPVMTKADLMDHWDDVVTDPEVTLPPRRLSPGRTTNRLSSPAGPSPWRRGAARVAGACSCWTGPPAASSSDRCPAASSRGCGRPARLPGVCPSRSSQQGPRCTPRARRSR